MGDIKNVDGDIYDLEETLDFFNNFLSDLESFKKTKKPLKVFEQKYPEYSKDMRACTYLSSKFNLLNFHMKLAKKEIDTIINTGTNVSDTMDEVISLYSQAKDELNKNKLKYGLQGQIRSMIDKTQLPPELPETVRNVINTPNVAMPAVPSGGKHRRKTKSRRTKRR